MRGRVIVGLIIATGGFFLALYAPKIIDRFDQPADRVAWYRIAGFGTMVIGFLFMFGLLESNPTATSTTFTTP